MLKEKYDDLNANYTNFGNKSFNNALNQVRYLLSLNMRLEYVTLTNEVGEDGIWKSYNGVVVEESPPLSPIAEEISNLFTFVKDTQHPSPNGEDAKSMANDFISSPLIENQVVESIIEVVTLTENVHQDLYYDYYNDIFYWNEAMTYIQSLPCWSDLMIGLRVNESLKQKLEDVKEDTAKAANCDKANVVLIVVDVPPIDDTSSLDSIGAYRPRIFFINEWKMNGSGMEKEEREETPLQGEDESRRSSPP
ncbi:hypothetical protein GmHk_17G049419 [Glycine max]|nr:hypothetical protein GmHk_17G049419 [Glycine max]